MSTGAAGGVKVFTNTEPLPLIHQLQLQLLGCHKEIMITAKERGGGRLTIAPTAGKAKTWSKGKVSSIYSGANCGRCSTPHFPQKVDLFPITSRYFEAAAFVNGAACC